MAQITFIEQDAPIEEYGRALYAVSRSILRALVDSLSTEDLTDLNTPLDQVRLRQLAKVVRLDRDKGMRGDGFEWAVHEAIQGKEPRVVEHVHEALVRASPHVKTTPPTSLLFGHERAKYLGFLDAVIDSAGTNSYLLPQGSGRPFSFGPWVALAAEGQSAEATLNDRIKKIWKTDLFLSAEGDVRYFAATVKSNVELLEGGKGLRVAIVPEAPSSPFKPGVAYSHEHGLWVVTLPDPNGFMGLFNDGYKAVGRALCALGKQPQPPYYAKPSAKAQKVQMQLESFGDARVIEVADALNEAAQQNLVNTLTRLVSVNAPAWLHIKSMTPSLIAPKPSFVKLD